MVRNRDLARHIRKMHLNDPQPDSDPEKKALTPLIPLHSPHNIDKEGFIVTDEMLGEIKAEINKDESQIWAVPSRPIESTSDFEDIKKQPEKEPSAGSRPIHPRSYERVNCPICQRRFCYENLYEHVSISHRDKIPALVLAEFNREYDRLVRGSGNHQINKPQKS